jgi:glutathionylspermidine synthase
MENDSLKGALNEKSERLAETEKDLQQHIQAAQERDEENQQLLQIVKEMRHEMEQTSKSVQNDGMTQRLISQLVNEKQELMNLLIKKADVSHKENTSPNPVTIAEFQRKYKLLRDTLYQVTEENQRLMERYNSISGKMKLIKRNDTGTQTLATVKLKLPTESKEVDKKIIVSGKSLASNPSMSVRKKIRNYNVKDN